MIFLTTRPQKVLASLVVGLALLSGIYIYTSTRQSTPLPPVVTALPTPITIQNPQQFLPTVDLRLPPEFSLDIPPSLPTFEAQFAPLSETTAAEFARSLGFLSAPKPISDPVLGPTLLWSTDHLGLVIRTAARTVSYSVNEPDYSIRGVNQDLVSKNLGVFIQHINKLSPLILEPKTYHYFFATSDENKVATERVQANIVEVDVSAHISTYPLIGTSQFTPNARIGLNSQGVVQWAELLFPASVITPIDHQPLLTLDEFRSSINSSQLHSLENFGVLNPYDHPPLGALDVQDVYLAYYQHPNQSIIQPVFVITASGQNENQQSSSAVFILPAVRQP